MSLTEATKARILASAAEKMMDVIERAVQEGFPQPNYQALDFQALAKVAEDAATWSVPTAIRVSAWLHLCTARKAAAGLYTLDATKSFGDGFSMAAASGPGYVDADTWRFDVTAESKDATRTEALTIAFAPGTAAITSVHLGGKLLDIASS